MCILYRYSNIFHPNYCKILEIKMKICKLLGCNQHLVLEDLTRKVEVSFFRKFILKKLCRKKEEGSVPVGFVHNPQLNLLRLVKKPRWRSK